MEKIRKWGEERERSTHIDWKVARGFIYGGVLLFLKRGGERIMRLMKVNWLGELQGLRIHGDFSGGGGDWEGLGTC